MLTADVIVVGAGPAGLSAAISAADGGADVIICDRDPHPGGQLVKQTHRFFGSEAERAGTRGIGIGTELSQRALSRDRVRWLPETSVIGLYPDMRLLLSQRDRALLAHGRRYVFATGASERPLLFENNDLPGVYGAGAVQTLMNVYGVAPGERMLMIGSGNIGLIVSYQLLQAGIGVAAVIEALPRIGGYLVHAGKIARAGIPILTRHTIISADGTDAVTGATVCQIDEEWQPIPGTERRLEVDAICIAVGLSPLCDHLWQAGCRMAYVPELGGHVPWHDDDQRTSVKEILVAGDAGGVEEASSAMLTGRLAGLTAAHDLGLLPHDRWQQERDRAREDLAALRAGPSAARILSGLRMLRLGAAERGVG